MARRQASFDDLMEFGSKLSWRVAVLLAVGSFLVFHFLAITTSPPAAETTLASLGSVGLHSLIHTLALFLQYLAPAGLLIGAFIGFIKQSRGKSLVDSARNNPNAISEMSWRDFERFIGEAFRRDGFHVVEHGGSSPDGGIDLVLLKDNERHLVQCKHWHSQQVGVTVVRELNDVIAAQDAHGVFVVTGGRFTREAREFAQKTRIQLLDGDALEKLIGTRSFTTSSASEMHVPRQSPPACPRCGTAMVQRVATKGKHVGRSFWGCQQYPKCTGIVQIS
jgi:restriction system protein